MSELSDWIKHVHDPEVASLNKTIETLRDELSRLSVSPLPEEIAGLVEHLKHVADSQDRIYPYLENKPRKAAAALERMAQRNSMLEARSHRIGVEVTEAFSDNQRMAREIAGLEQVVAARDHEIDRLCRLIENKNEWTRSRLEELEREIQRLQKQETDADEIDDIRQDALDGSIARISALEYERDRFQALWRQADDRAYELQNRIRALMPAGDGNPSTSAQENSMISKEMIEAAARAGYERRIRETFHVEAGQSFLPRSGQRTLSWDELPPHLKEQEYAIAEAALTAALSSQWRGMESARKDGKPILLQHEMETIQVIGHWDGRRWLCSWDHQPLPGLWTAWTDLPPPPPPPEEKAE